MRLYEAICDEFADSREKPSDNLRRIQKFDADGKMFPFDTACAGCMHVVMRAKAGVGTDDAGASHIVVEEKSKYFRVQEIFGGTGVFIEVNDYLLRRARREHSSLMS